VRLLPFKPLGKAFYVTDNDRFVGFCIDLMAAIANELKISDYEYVEVFNGSKRNLDNTWTGIVGGLIARVSNAHFIVIYLF